MSASPLPVGCDVTVQSLTAQYPFVAPLVERFGISSGEYSELPLWDAARRAGVAGHALCGALEASIRAGRIVA